MRHVLKIALTFSYDRVLVLRK